MQIPDGTHQRWASRLAATLASMALLAACGGSSDPDDGGHTSGSADPATRASIESVAREAMAQYHMRALILRVTVNGQNVYTSAMGESQPGVPATPQMHFRNGSFAFTYIGQIFARLVDQPQYRLSLDDKLANWMPQLPRAGEISLRNLLNMTSGYADYVYQPVMKQALYSNPDRGFGNDELLDIGLSVPERFAPGTNWGYSHTNYVILGEVLERITGKPLDALMQEHILGPMKLTATSGNGGTVAVPEPALHSYTSERREFLGIPAATPFYEDATYWNPSWTTANGAVMTTNIVDLTTSMEIVGSGAQVSARMHDEQVGLKLVDFGHQTPECEECRTLRHERSYGLGVTLLGPWIAQTKLFAGSGVSSAYLPSARLAISVATTYAAEAFDAEGDFKNASGALVKHLAELMAPGQAPPWAP